MHPNHDQLFRYALAFPALLAAWLRSVLPKAIADDIDWSTFAAGKDHIPGIRLRPHIADAVCSAQRRGRPDRVWFVLEHKSYPDPDWHGQTLRYVVHLRRLLQTERRSRPPAVVAVLVYHGLQALPGPVPDGASPYDAFEPHLPVVIVDFSRHPPEPRQPGPPALLQLVFLSAHAVLRLDAEHLLAAIDSWGSLLRELEAGEGPPVPQDALDNLLWYLVDHSDLTEQQVFDAFARHLRHPEDITMTTGQRIRLASRAEGKAEGRAEGKAEGKAETLLRLLGRRFGPLDPATTTRVLAATIDQLDTWTDRVLDAPSLAAVFAA